MRRWKFLLVLFFVPFDANDEFDIFETCDWCSVGTCCECEELLPLLIIKFIKDNVPEPLDKLMLGMQRFHVPRHRLQQLEVQVLRTAHELLQLLRRVQKFQHRLVEKLVEATFERVNLLFALDVEEMLDIKIDKLLPILLSHEYLVTVFLQILCDLITKELIVDRKGTRQNIFERRVFVVVQDVLETFPDVRLPLLEIIKVKWLVEQDLVACGDYWNIKNNLVLWCKSHEHADQLEVKWRLETSSLEVIESVIWIVHKHAVVWIEEFLEKQLEELLLDTTLVNCWFTLKNHPKRLLVYFTTNTFFYQCIQTIFKNVIPSDLNSEMSNTKYIVDGCGTGGIRIEKLSNVLQNGVSDLLMALLSLNDSKQFSLSVSVERPWIIIQSKKAVPVEVTLASTC